MSSPSKGACPKSTCQSAIQRYPDPSRLLQLTPELDDTLVWHTVLSLLVLTLAVLLCLWLHLSKLRPFVSIRTQKPWTHIPPQEVVFIWFVPTLQKEFVQYLYLQWNKPCIITCINRLGLYFTGMTYYQPNRYVKFILSILTFFQLQQLKIIAIKIYTPTYDHMHPDLLLFED